MRSGQNQSVPISKLSRLGYLSPKQNPRQNGQGLGGLTRVRVERTFLEVEIRLSWWARAPLPISDVPERTQCECVCHGMWGESLFFNLNSNGRPNHVSRCRKRQLQQQLRDGSPDSAHAGRPRHVLYQRAAGQELRPG